VGRISDASPSTEPDFFRLLDADDDGGSDCSDDMDGDSSIGCSATSTVSSVVVVDDCMMSVSAVFQSFSLTVIDVLLVASEVSFVVAVVVLLGIFISFSGSVTLLVGVEVCFKEVDEAVGQRVELRSAVITPLRAAASDDAACFRDDCELGLVGVAFPDFCPVVLDVDEVLARLVGTVLLFDVEITFAGSRSGRRLSLLLLLMAGAGVSISCTLAGVLDLNFTALLPFSEADLVDDSTALVALVEDDDATLLNC